MKYSQAQYASSNRYYRDLPPSFNFQFTPRGLYKSRRDNIISGDAISAGVLMSWMHRLDRSSEMETSILFTSLIIHASHHSPAQPKFRQQ